MLVYISHHFATPGFRSCSLHRKVQKSLQSWYRHSFKNVAEGGKTASKSPISTEENNCIDLHPEINRKLTQSLERENIKLHVIIGTTQVKIIQKKN